MRKFNLGIVLGFKLNDDGGVANILKKRLDKAADFYSKGKIQKVLLSGGTPSKRSRVSESCAMYDYLVSTGLPRNALIKEEKSRDTFGNAIFSKKIADRIKPAKIFVFTSNWHLRRARLIFEKFFGGAYGLSFVECGGWNTSTLIYVLSGYENKFYKITEVLLKAFKNLQKESAVKKLFSLHPLYSRNPERILKMSDGELASKLGITEKEVPEIKKLLGAYVTKR